MKCGLDGVGFGVKTQYIAGMKDRRYKNMEKCRQKRENAERSMRGGIFGLFVELESSPHHDLQEKLLYVILLWKVSLFSEKRIEQLPMPFLWTCAMRGVRAAMSSQRLFPCGRIKRILLSFRLSVGLKLRKQVNEQAVALQNMVT